MSKIESEKWQHVLKVDFSLESKNKNAMKESLLEYLEQQNEALTNTNNKEILTMKKQTKNSFFRRFKSLPVAVVIGIIAISATAFAIVNYFSLGKHAQYSVGNSADIAQIEAEASKTQLVVGLAGKLFDIDGNQLETYGDIMKNGAYNSKGEPVTYSQNEDGTFKIQTRSESMAESDDRSTKYATASDAKKHTVFDFQTPSYIPSGYSLDGYRIYKNDDGSEANDSKYVEMYLNNDSDSNKQVYIQVRFMDEETAYGTGGGGKEKMQINGHEAVVSDNSVDLLIGDVMYMIRSSSNELTIEEIIKIAESL